MKARRKFIKSSLAGIAGATTLPLHSFDFVNTGLKIDNLASYSNPESFWEELKDQFVFDEGLHYFNNASLGSSPQIVREATSSHMETLEKFPSKYMWGGWNDAKEAVRKKVADLFSVSPEEIALNHNTTEGMNLIARSFDLQPGDEVILGNHEHSSGTACWEYWQASKGVNLIRPTLPILPSEKSEIVKVYEKAITPRTKIISMCHVVNTNGMILPVKEVSELAHRRGIKVAVDGAQGAGMFNFSLAELGCDFYTASAHKWLFGPKEVSLFYAREGSQKLLRPLVVARGYEDESIRRLENYNTRSLPEVLALGNSIDFINQIGIDNINQRSYELKSYFRSKIAANSRFKLKSPESDDLSCAIQVVEVLERDVNEVKDQLFEEFGIDCRPMSSHDLNALRISLSIYITKKDIDYLIESLEKLA